jgi:hypothetical protein
MAVISTPKTGFATRVLGFVTEGRIQPIRRLGEASELPGGGEPDRHRTAA